MRRAFTVTSVSWAASLPLATWASGLHAAPAAYAFALLVYGAGGLVCHQLPARSFQLWTTPMPVCARCVGLYLGGAVAALASNCGWARAASRRVARATLALAAVPLFGTLLFEWCTGVTPANWVRALSGAPLGGGVAWVIASGSNQRRGALTSRGKAMR